MAEQTGISWADGTFNPWEGCQETGSPACVFCYAKTRNARFNGGVAVNWGPHAARRRTSPDNWKNLGRWNRRPEKLNAPAGTKPLIFGGSLCDPFDKAVPAEWRRDYFDEIREAPNLILLLLTKRPQNIVRLSEEAGGLPSNAAVGCTIVTQEECDRDLPHLLRAKWKLAALFSFVSMEPLSERVDLRLSRRGVPRCGRCHGGGSVRPYDGSDGGAMCPSCDGRGYLLDSLDWLICGGESGPHARPSEEAWFLDLERQADAASIPFHFKQRGGRDKDKGGKLLQGRLRQERPRIPA